MFVFIISGFYDVLPIIAKCILIEIIKCRHSTNETSIASAFRADGFSSFVFMGSIKWIMEKMGLQFLRIRRTWAKITRCIVMLMSLMTYRRRIVQHRWVVLTTKFIMWQLLRMTVRIRMIQTVGMIKALCCRQHIPTIYLMNCAFELICVIFSLTLMELICMIAWVSYKCESFCFVFVYKHSFKYGVWLSSNFAIQTITKNKRKSLKKAQKTHSKYTWSDRWRWLIWNKADERKCLETAHWKSHELQKIKKLKMWWIQNQNFKPTGTHLHNSRTEIFLEGKKQQQSAADILHFSTMMHYLPVIIFCWTTTGMNGLSTGFLTIPVSDRGDRCCCSDWCSCRTQLVSKIAIVPFSICDWIGQS